MQRKKNKKRNSLIHKAKRLRKSYLDTNRLHREKIYELIRNSHGLVHEFNKDPAQFSLFKQQQFWDKVEKGRGRPLDYDNVCGVVARFVFTANVRNKAQTAYKIERILDMLYRDKCEVENVVETIRQLGGKEKSYRIACKKYPRTEDAVTSDEAKVAVLETTPTPSNDDHDKSSISRTAAANKSTNDERSDEPNTRENPIARRKPEWAKQEHSLNIQVQNSVHWDTIMDLNAGDEIVLIVQRRPFGGDYVDLVLMQVDDSDADG